MLEKNIPDGDCTAKDSGENLESFWKDFQKRMPPSHADKFLGVAKNTVMAAIVRGEIEPIRVPGGKRVFVTPEILAQWVKTYW